ncbi:outer membrane beta-barrel protein [Legionella cardiaca]|uniref:Outer membrane beta-barrel protein n=1 Tax=Legionella cardiaca TaxID=1071983 RepID=A0ABY8AU56_9GAMM|nr:outer membrane beta-barrel protein [Legionella cardiaca]WED43721.1 outer membrane beta-barrel protein [Legionella cardiaca]
MKKSIQIFLYATSIVLIVPGFGQTAKAKTTTSTLPYPATTGPLVVNSHPFDIEAGLLEKIYINGVISGLGLWQNNPIAGNSNSLLDLDNGQLFIQNTKGLLQFYVQAGGYSFPSLGTSYLRMDDTTHNFFGPVPVAFIKLAPSGNFSIMAGKLFTLIGAENSFTFQNFNIERGLLWNQTNEVNRGVQVNYNPGPVSASVSLNDGFYSGQLNWLSGLLIYTINAKNSLSVIASGNIKHDDKSSVVTPLAQNNSQIYDLVYSYTFDRLTISPTLQFTHIPKDLNIGLNSASTFGVALATKFAFNTYWSITGRAEYIDTTGGTNVTYGPGSNAWSLTLTPTYQRGIFFARGEASLVVADNITAGSAFGQDGTNHSQGRLLIETGVLF